MIAINPECAQNKHRNCDGHAMCDDPQCNDIHPCDCDCHRLHNPELVEKLEAERSRIVRPAGRGPAPKQDIAELVRAVSQTDRGGHRKPG